jgi:acyl carrier protein
MDSTEFFDKFKGFLAEFDPGLELEVLTPETHLWAEGYLDSFAMLSVAAFIEDEIGRELALNPDTLSDFFTIERMYQAYVASGEAAR